MSINLGVFQGSILGPLLFCIFINDLSRLDLKGEIVFFADDCSLILIGDSYQEVEECAIHDLKLIEKWHKAKTYSECRFYWDFIKKKFNKLRARGILDKELFQEYKNLRNTVVRLIRKI
jgi:hypothetical protein